MPVPGPGGNSDGDDDATPSATRIYDYYIGGKDNFAEDRALARQIEEIYPLIRHLAVSSRQFTGRAVTWCAGELGIAQYLDLGCGLPGPGGVLESARAVIPDARYVGVDRDADVASHARVLLSGEDGTAAVHADLRDVAGVLGSKDVRALISFERPAVLLASLVLHFIPAAEAREAIAGYVRVLAPGSAVVLCCGRCDDPRLGGELLAAARKLWPGCRAASPLHNHSREEMLGFLGGLDLAAPGLVPARAWRGDMPDPGLRPLGPGYALAAVAVRR